ncbi:LpqB family beta-propeller domain-containing protein [Agrococcus terreus]|uniref:Sporulation and spore germination n=1 Tax=Agrococcus terreus TaxID=574649 RepID=A0ABQ2KPE1_9MICO|nr:LpqB family beta-propeller domain-containing protein [Agrococcus terreus]GGN87470.1 hypothetical protein GCM10010968_22060 [Agrococcus terreus]
MRRALAVPAAIAALALVGCVAIPDAGPVTEGQVDTSVQSSDLVFLAEEPAAGATQEDIILGFLEAAVSPVDDFSIAREYLTADAGEGWDPGAGVLVRSGDPEVSLTGETAATAVVTTVRAVDEHGAARIADEERILEFRLLRVGGEWRISQAPDGIVLSNYHFGQLFRSHVLHWLTPDGTRAVADVHWFERTVQTLPGRIVEAVLAGPSAWLAAGVATAAAPDATLVGAPEVDGSVASVTVSIAQIEQRPGGLEPLAQQLALSLRSVGVREVRVGVEGLEGFEATSADAAPIDEGEVDQRPLILEGATLRPVGAGASAIDDVGPVLASIGATSFTVGEVGGVAHTGTTAAWIVPGADPVVVSADAGVVPTVDDSGWVLLQERSAPQRLLAWRDGERAVLELPTGTGRVAAMELSRDGTRLAVASTDGAESRIWIATVVRDEDGRPTSLSEPYPLPQIDGTATDVTWASSTQVAVLAASGDAAQVVLLTIGGDADQLPPPGMPVRAIVGGSEGTSTLRALGEDGSLLSLRGRVWLTAVDVGAVSLIATQQ